MINHIVLFSFHGNASEKAATARSFMEDLLQLPAVIAPLGGITVHLNENPDEDFDLMLHAAVADPKALAEYSAHPAHVAAVAKVRDKIKSRACVDYVSE